MSRYIKPSQWIATRMLFEICVCASLCLRVLYVLEKYVGLCERVHTCARSTKAGSKYAFVSSPIDELKHNSAVIN